LPDRPVGADGIHCPHLLKRALGMRNNFGITTSTHPSHQFAIPRADGVRPEAITEPPAGDRRSDDPVCDPHASRGRIERWPCRSAHALVLPGFCSIAAALPRGRNLPIRKERTMVSPREERP
jgi:hypothetical protein